MVDFFEFELYFKMNVFTRECAELIVNPAFSSNEKECSWTDLTFEQAWKLFHFVLSSQVQFHWRQDNLGFSDLSTIKDHPFVNHVELIIDAVRFLFTVSRVLLLFRFSEKPEFNARCGLFYSVNFHQSKQ